MTKRDFKSILASHKLWLEGDPDGKRADLSNQWLTGVDLHGANLSQAILRGAGLCGANLANANLVCADLHGASLEDANLVGAKLHDADLSRANLAGANLNHAYMFRTKLVGASLLDADMHGTTLRDADLSNADLRNAKLVDVSLAGADLCSANFDFATWPLWCGSLTVKIDKRLAAQLLYHALSAMQSCADDKDVAAVLRSKACLKLANQFHRMGECGELKPPKKGRRASNG